MIFHDVIQNSEQWYQLRSGKATSSKFGIIMANYGKAFGNPAKEYATKIALEQVKGSPLEEQRLPKGYWIEQGHENEPIAIQLYEEKTFNTVSNGGFCISSKYDWVGGSADGLIKLDNGGAEVKSVMFTTHKKNIKRNSFDPAYKWQKIGNMWVYKLDYIDFISYCPDYPKETQLFIHRMYADDYKKEFTQLENRLDQFGELIEEEKKLITTPLKFVA